LTISSSGTPAEQKRQGDRRSDDPQL
jgi:hypothetical protein